jgi:predicted dehydrogenase
MEKRRDFIRKLSAGTAGVVIGGVASGLSPRSYSRIIGANDRLNIAIMGLGRRYGEYAAAISKKENNVELNYLCDVMKSQREKAFATFATMIDNKPVLENDIRKVLSDPKVDAIFNAAPDHWHTPGACMALEAGKHVYLEKPCSHNPHETELLLASRRKHNKLVQMGNQYRSVPHFQEIINEIHNGVIGTPYKAISFLSSSREELPIPVKAPVPEGLDWNLFQGPAPRTEYTHLTWDYNWHWYGWNYGTAEIGNNGIHELDIARWALEVEYPEYVEVEAEKRHFINDGWTMYDTMDATFKFAGKKIIKWDGKSRTAYKTYGSSRGTIVYGSAGTVFIDPFVYKVFERGGNMIKEQNKISGADDGTSAHMVNFFNAIRGKEKLNSPIEIGAISNLLSNYANISYRIGRSFEIDPATGRIFDREAMKLWSREYEPGWEPIGQ